MNARMRFLAGGIAMSAFGFAGAQVPDLLSSFEMGGRGMGMGGAIYSNTTDPSASYWNPAGLGHIGAGQVEINFRNRPSTTTMVSGPDINPDEVNSHNFGKNQFSFLGAAVPMAGGTIGISYAVGGYMRQRTVGETEIDPSTTRQRNNLDEQVTEFITLAYGTRRNSAAFGAGVVFARQWIHQIVNEQITGIPPTMSDDSESATGVGAIVGAQFAPNPSTSFGISYRTEIDLSGFNLFAPISDSVPARLQAGIITRRDGLRGGRDFLIAGVDAAFYFDNNPGRKEHVSGGVGIEYNLAQAFGWVPIRLGFRGDQAGGDGFTNRTVVTFGLGYRPNNGRYWVDISSAAGTGQKKPDFAVSLGYAFGR